MEAGDSGPGHHRTLPGAHLPWKKAWMCVSVTAPRRTGCFWLMILVHWLLAITLGLRLEF